MPIDIATLRDWAGFLLSIVALIGISAGFFTIPLRVKRLESRQSEHSKELSELRSRTERLVAISDDIRENLRDIKKWLSK